mgnify:CR=1 FL=1
MPCLQFDGVLSNVSQDVVYNSCVHEAVDSSLAGYNATVFAYGQVCPAEAWQEPTCQQASEAALAALNSTAAGSSCPSTVEHGQPATAAACRTCQARLRVCISLDSGYAQDSMVILILRLPACATL